jgi:anthraniloyl-CoA monooxygenase
MDIVSLGGGPAGLYFSILMKKAFPDARIRVFERNRADDTFGWGVVFSEETLSHFGEADRESYDAIRGAFAYWDDIETYYGGTCVTSTGHGFCGMSRRRLLEILQARCRSLGVELEFQREVASADEFRGAADLVVACDGVNSAVRTQFADTFRPDVRWGKAKFTWLGTTRPLRAFTFHFKTNAHGLFQVHAYPFEKGLSTWIVECREETWRAAGLDTATEEETVRYCEELFASELDGHRLLTNKSLWRTFPTIRCATWRHENVVLVGDAAHTAHFSIGSGTKLAMEDAIALADAFVKHGTLASNGACDVPRALAAYEEARFVDVLKLQRAADVSREWFENSARYVRQHPLQFSFNLMTRSKRITYDNLAKRDPKLVAAVTEWFRESTATPKASDGSPRPPIFTPLRLREMTVANRIVVSPMCQYSAVDGVPNDWHLVHLGSRAIGGAGLVMTEMTDVADDARITKGCTGLYEDEHVEEWRRIVDFVHAHSAARIGVQLAHAGRKGSAFHPWEGFDRPLSKDEGAWETIAPSPLPFAPGWPAPREMTRADMHRVRDEFVRATRMADDAGFDLVEVHMAHGYLLSTFISPLTNRRADAYGGSLANRMRWPLEVFRAMRAAWPAAKPMSVRITAVDWAPGGLVAADAVEVARALKDAGCDVIDVSSSGNSIESRPEYGRMFQVPFADRIRHEVEVPVMAVGAIQGADHANTVIAAGRADLCAIARPHLFDPYLTLHAAAESGFPDVRWPGQYLLGRPAKKG